VHTTRRTGQLAAAELLKGAQQGGKPGALLRRLSQNDPQVREWLSTWQGQTQPTQWQTLLP